MTSSTKPFWTIGDDDLAALVQDGASGAEEGDVAIPEAYRESVIENLRVLREHARLVAVALPEGVSHEAPAEAFAP